ncbi:MAG TPA: FKBP-type peptidyl-prolyl cis-trans isomerase [Phycisphaerales bacterium]|nr:FKBP-type peptidyl-prolyl cis-trans isomerase [Phycisphaerales bacterium]
MRTLAGVLGAACVMTVALAQPPAPKPGEPGQTPPAPPAPPAPAPAPQPAPSAVQPGLTPPVAPAATQPAKKWEIAADAKPVARQEIDGIVIEDFVIGTGAEVKPGNAVLAFYHGTLKATGAEFDSAFVRGQPIPFSLDGVIPGWTKGVPGMKVGGLRRLTIPAAQAYGAQEKRDQMGRVTIPSNSDLVFVIEMVDVIQSQDTTVGTGEEVGRQAVCVTHYVVKDAEGKEIDKSTAPYVWLPEENAFNLGFIGMKVGGKRVLNVPATMNMPMRGYPPAPAQPPVGIPATIEVELVSVRNLAPVNKPKQ